jgi:hypothetical protein
MARPSSEDGWSALLHVITLKAKMAVCNTSVRGESSNRAGSPIKGTRFENAACLMVFSWSYQTGVAETAVAGEI